MSKSRIQIRVENLLTEAAITSPAIPVEKLARNLGVQINFAPFEGDLSGLIYREQTPEGNHATVIGVNSLHSPNRRRFTVAHEIGHLVLGHLDSLEQEIHIDRNFIGIRRDGRSALAVDNKEIAANQFAAELLMPTEMLKNDFEVFRADSIDGFDYEDDELASALADRYKVSLQAMVIRLTRLGLIGQGVDE
ncbi:MAG: ImmA/IrrE family metallo-endopeptidase [Proteobacteria bacterium]|nr:MAG: ImmA/IrrE family metallo-endopeptidase [Pseudomonadota bacterium]